MLAKVRVRPALAVVLVVAVVLGGCSFLRPKKKVDTTYADQPVEQLYAVGAQRLDEHRWSEAVTYFKEVERQHPYSEWSRRSILMEAYSHYQANDYDDAVADANRFIELYPGNGAAAYAYYLRAQCYFEQILDVGRDQAATEQAGTAMREVTRRFPHTEYAADARLKTDMISDQLAGKEMTIGRYYLRSGNTLAAIGRFKLVIERYQTTSHTPEALERLVEAYLTLGLIDEAKRNAAVLGYNYPGDYWYQAAYTLMTSKGYQLVVQPNGHARHGLLGGVTSFFAPAPINVPASQLAAPDQAPAAAPAPAQSTPAPPKKKNSWLNPLGL
ncbi:MAG TPA: outer membrane protein assembly factor BamD [Caulobacteraceae bacterium]|nr:outer membrane protein assembly factor BamD [Caulobacteraceae bacterium]